MTAFYQEFSLKFEGKKAEDHELDFYDVSQALIGFQRSLALTTHLILNDKVITQAPALKGAKILARPPQEGSWEIIAAVIGGIGYLGTRPKDTPIGHIIYSAYDYVVASALGFHVDYEQSLGQQYERIKSKDITLPALDETRFDSVIEKCENAIKDMHRPIISSKTADIARVSAHMSSGEEYVSRQLDAETFQHVSHTYQQEQAIELVGRISSYNINTYRGRVFVEEYNRPIPFELSESARTTFQIAKVVGSLTANAHDRFKGDGYVTLVVLKNESRLGRVKSFYVLEVAA